MCLLDYQSPSDLSGVAEDLGHIWEVAPERAFEIFGFGDERYEAFRNPGGPVIFYGAPDPVVDIEVVLAESYEGVADKVEAVCFVGKTFTLPASRVKAELVHEVQHINWVE